MKLTREVKKDFSREKSAEQKNHNSGFQGI